MNGYKIEVDVAYTKIYKSAKKSIYVIDNYIDHIDDFIKDYPNVDLKLNVFYHLRVFSV